MVIHGGQKQQTKNCDHITIMTNKQKLKCTQKKTHKNKGEKQLLQNQP